jgi:hypothetical protein
LQRKKRVDSLGVGRSLLLEDTENLALELVGKAYGVCVFDGLLVILGDVLVAGAASADMVVAAFLTGTDGLFRDEFMVIPVVVGGDALVADVGGACRTRLRLAVARGALFWGILENHFHGHYCRFLCRGGRLPC